MKNFALLTNRSLMPKRCNKHSSFFWVAFAALMGILSLSNAARACADVKVSKACCVAGPFSNCSCCDSSSPSVASSGFTQAFDSLGWSATSVVIGHHTSRPQSSCECRSNDPAAPAPKPVSGPPNEYRLDQFHEQDSVYLTFVRKLVPSYSLASPNDGTPKCPVYLRTRHLLV